MNTEPVSPKQLAHLVLRTPRFKEMCEFYLLLLNARPAFANNAMMFLRYDEEHHRLVIVNAPHLRPPGPDAAGLAHFALTYRSLEELLGNYLRLKAHGIHPCWCVNHGFTTSLYYSDPDGTLVETQFDNMDTAAADVFMRTPYFAKNPIGVDFDPDLLIERLRRGDPLSELIKQGSAPFALLQEPTG
jgi:catechol-2,3-dioxygenase